MERYRPIIQIGRALSPVSKSVAVRPSRCVSATASVVPDLRSIPSPWGLPVLGTLPAMLARGGASKLHEYADYRHKQLGVIFRDRVGPVSCVFLSDPEDMRSIFAYEGKYPLHVLPEAWTLYNDIYKVSRGLFFMNGEEWLQNRRITNKLLLKGDFSWIERACQEVSSDLVQRWTKTIKQNDILPNLETQLYRWSIEIMLSVIMGANRYKSVKEELRDVVDELATNTHKIFITSAKMQLISAKIASMLGLSIWKDFVKAMDQSLNSTKVLVNKMMEDPADDEGLLSKLKNENVPKSDMVKVLIDFLIAAGDTTAYSMEWLLYSIGTNTDVQEKLRKEFIVNDSNTYLRNVIRESLRLYPVAPFLTRILTQNVTVRGYKLPPGTLVLLSIYTSGRDSNIFQDPERFYPDRWSRVGNNNLVTMQQACLPFGFGTRSCIGKKIAEIQLQKTIHKIVSSFDLTVENKDEIEMVLKMVAVPSKPLRLKLTKL